MGYNMKSMKAEEFINDEEILESLAYAKKNKDNQSLINEILERAKKAKGISHKEAAVLMECDIPEVNEQIKELAKEIKQKFYGNRIVMFAPLYLSNYCVNGCTYCPYHYKNKHIARKKLSQEDIRKEVIALQDMGHKRLALEAGEDGLVFYKAIAEHYQKALRPGGALVLEIGWQQRKAVTALLAENGWAEIRCIQDFGGNDRCVTARRPK